MNKSEIHLTAGIRVRPKHVLLLHTGSLLMEGVEILLGESGESAFEMSCTAAAGPAELRRELATQQPDVLITDDSDPAFNLADLMACLREMGSMRLIVLSRETSKIDIYTKNELPIVHSDQLVSAIME